MSIPDRIDAVRSNPDLLNELGSREFEEFVAELLASFGWDISITAATRDGGHDLLAISRDATGLETVWAVECKRYAQNQPVGVGVVRSLYGVKHGLRIPQALIVTTSRFTAEATEFARRVGDIAVADRNVVLQWVQNYKRNLIAPPYLALHRFRSCFLSYSHLDEVFASKLVARLRAAGVRIWFAPEDLQAGKKIHEEIAQAIEKFDRLLVVLSEHSILSPWVQNEIRRARRREIKEKTRLLFPISLIPFERLRKWELFDSDLGQDLAIELREYLVVDFSKWKNPSEFEKQVVIVIKGLVV